MTVVAAYRGIKGSLNAMMADTVCSARDKPTEAAFWTDKLALLYGNTYATGVGDADIINGVRLVADFLDPDRPNFRDPATIDAVLGAVERLWAVRAGAGGQRFGSKGSVLFVCNRSDVFYWVCGYDNETRRFERPRAPHEVGEGECVVFWGSDRFTVRRPQLEPHRDLLQSDPFKTIAKLICAVDSDAREKGMSGLLYALDGRFSAVALPHKTSTPLTRLRPFSLPEWLVRENGAEMLSMLEDPEFMAYALPPRA